MGKRGGTERETERQRGRGEGREGDNKTVLSVSLLSNFRFRSCEI